MLSHDCVTVSVNNSASVYANCVTVYMFILLTFMPVDIVQWHAEIWNFNGYLHCVIIKLKLNFLNIISKVSQLIAFILWTILTCIFNINAIFYSLTIFAVFPFSPIVQKFTIDYLCLWFKLSQLIWN